MSSFVTQAAIRQIPGARTVLEVNDSATALDLSGSVGKTIKMWAVGGTIYVRGAASAPTAVTTDFPIAEDSYEEFVITRGRCFVSAIGSDADCDLHYEIEP